MQAKMGSGDESDANKAKLLYHLACLRGGYDISNPMDFASLVTELL
jgi:hypothetical protein